MKLLGKYLVYATGTAVVLYGLVLLQHVYRAEDLGLDCLFADVQMSGEVDSQPGPRISWVDRDTRAIGPRPRRGDRLVSVGGRRVPTFLHVKRAVAALARSANWSADGEVLAAKSADALAAALAPPVNRSVAGDVPASERPASPAGALGGAALATVGAERWVRVDFIASSSRGSNSSSSSSTSSSSRGSNIASNSSTSNSSGGSSSSIAGQRVSSAWLQLKPLPNQFLMLSIAWFLLEMIILNIGAIAVRMRPGDQSAAMFFALCAVHVVTFMGAFHWSNLVGTRVLVYPFVFCAILLAPMTLHFYLLFPRPRRLIQQRPRATLAAIYAMPAAWIVFMFICLSMSHRLYEQAAEPAELIGWLKLLSASIYGYLVVAVTLFAVGWVVLINGYAKAHTAAQRNQFRWVLAAVLLATALTGYLLYLASTDRAAFAYGTSTRLTLYLTSVLFTLAYAVSITRYKLLEVGQHVNRGMLYVIISLGTTALYCLMVGAGTALLGKYYFRWENALAAGLAAMLVVVVLGWIRDRFQKGLDRRFIREKYQLNKAMQRLSNAVDQLVEPAVLARQFLRSAADAVGVQEGVIYLRDPRGARFGPAARSGRPAADAPLAADSPLVAELRVHAVLSSRGVIGTIPSAGKFQLRELGAELGVALELDGDVIGLAILGPKEDSTPYTPEDFNFLAALARTTALALRSARERLTIGEQQERLQAQVGKIAELQQQIYLLQGELLGHGEGAASEATDAATDSGAKQLPELKHQIRGKSPAVRHMLGQAARIARSESSVVIRGESGTGKELLARAIHDSSPRAAGPFVPLHCAALSAGLLESELFGHVKGAFTGADRARVGRFEMAHGGTLFLDEIGDISLETQTKLLRVLQERSFERVGGADTVQVDVRLITATHQNLEMMIRKSRFRQDLFYRLNVISIWCPPLRERPEDIFDLSLHFLRRYSERSDKAIRRIEDDAVEAMAAYPWPGNIRQLENAIERACVLAESDSIRASDLPPEVLAWLQRGGTTLGGTGSASVRARGRRRGGRGVRGTGLGGTAGLPSSGDLSGTGSASDGLSGTGLGGTGSASDGLSGADLGGTAGLPSSGDLSGADLGGTGSANDGLGGTGLGGTGSASDGLGGDDLGGTGSASDGPGDTATGSHEYGVSDFARTGRRPIDPASDRSDSDLGGTGSASDELGGADLGGTGSASGGLGGTGSDEYGVSDFANDPSGGRPYWRKMTEIEALMAAHAKGEDSDLQEEVNTLERGRLQMAMAEARGNKAEAARILGMSRSTLFYKLKRLGLGVVGCVFWVAPAAAGDGALVPWVACCPCLPTSGPRPRK